MTFLAKFLVQNRKLYTKISYNERFVRRIFNNLCENRFLKIFTKNVVCQNFIWNYFSINIIELKN